VVTGFGNGGVPSAAGKNIRMPTLSLSLRLCVRDLNAPDKTRILQSRSLATRLAKRIRDRDLAARLVRAFNDAYLALQLATIADDAGTTDRRRRDCIAIIEQIERASGKAGSGVAPARSQR
jgi:hypothetical protein